MAAICRAPAQAQTYGTSFPICIQTYEHEGGIYISCEYRSMAAMPRDRLGPRRAMHQQSLSCSVTNGSDRTRPSAILEQIGAGEGNRTLVFSLEGCCSTIELHPLGG